LQGWVAYQVKYVCKNASPFHLPCNLLGSPQSFGLKPAGFAYLKFHPKLTSVSTAV
jgi:hypothetical protein